MKTALSALILLVMPLSFIGQNRAVNKAMAKSPKAYALFDEQGKPAAWSDFVEEAKGADVVLFGEYHDDPIMHWLQAELVRAMLDAGVQPVLGAEMMEADDQLVLDEFLAGWVSDDKLKAAANLWPNHFTDYHPLLELARDHELRFIATNVPRRYASYVYQNGLAAREDLSDEAKQFLPTLPVPYDPTLPGYHAMLAMAGGHGGETLPMAQAIKDATMAHFILANRKKGVPFVHFNGAYHSQDHEGIEWYLHHAKPRLKVLTLHHHMSDDVTMPSPEEVGRGHFLLQTHARMTRTH